MTDDFFRNRLDQMIDHAHPLAVLASRLPWQKMQSAVTPQFAHKQRPLQQIEQAPNLGGITQWTGVKVQVVVDLGFRGKDVEQAIGHLKSDNRMQRCWLQGQTGDALWATTCAG